MRKKDKHDVCLFYFIVKNLLFLFGKAEKELFLNCSPKKYIGLIYC